MTSWTGAVWFVYQFHSRILEPVCCKNLQKNSSWPVTGLWSRGPLKDLKDSKLILNESKLFPLSSRVSLVPFRTFRGPLFPKLVTGQELLCAVSNSRPSLIGYITKVNQSKRLFWILSKILDFLLHGNYSFLQQIFSIQIFNMNYFLDPQTE